MERKIIKTEDGSYSLRVEQLNENYHSTHGAIQESRHVFIRAGLDHLYERFPGKEIRILEVGFGTGLNALMTYHAAASKKSSLVYHTLEAFPVEQALLAGLGANYSGLLSENAPQAAGQLLEVFEQMHLAGWNEAAVIGHMQLKKINDTLQHALLEKEFYDLVFFDAFGPPVQPEMWTEEIFRKIAAAMQPGGILVTYCAKGEVKRNMKKAGLAIERLQGPPGKREMTRGTRLQ